MTVLRYMSKEEMMEPSDLETQFLSQARNRVLQVAEVEALRSKIRAVENAISIFEGTDQHFSVNFGRRFNNDCGSVGVSIADLVMLRDSWYAALERKLTAGFY